MPPSAGYHVGGYLRRANIYYGGSFFRRPRQSFYVRRTQSLFHYPVYSKKERCPINWIAGKTLSGYEAVKKFGPHTVQVSNVPFMITNQAIEDRLHRFFIKYGTVTHCHSVPHPGDSFQSSGVAYVSFANKFSAFKAVQEARLRFSDRFHCRIATLRSLETDVHQNPAWYRQEREACQTVVAVARCLYRRLAAYPEGIFLDKIRALVETSDQHETLLDSPVQSVMRIYGSWREFFDAHPFRKLFALSLVAPQHNRFSSSENPRSLTKDIYAKRYRIARKLSLMIQRGITVKLWKEEAVEQSKTRKQRKTLPATQMSNNELFSSFSPQLNVSTALPGKLPSKKTSESSDDGLSLEVTFQRIAHKLSQDKHRSASPTINCSGAANQFLIKTPSAGETRFWEKLAQKAATQQIKVYRRLLSPETVECHLRHAHIHTKRAATVARSPYWKRFLPPLPSTVEKTLRDMHHPRKLPESLQYQSRPEGYYKRRIYDERHMLSREIAHKRALKRHQRRTVIRARRAVRHRTSATRLKRVAQSRILSRIGLSHPKKGDVHEKRKL